MWWWIGGGVIGAVVVVAALIALVDVLRRREELTRAQVMAYAILILVVPLAGAIIYAMYGRQKTARSAA
jgi:asparagine N-glycosylation enzyme membrane subunit Stt3